jgi:pyruvate carboxylase subunit B
MKYTVTVGDRRVHVEVQGDRVRLNGHPIEARLVSIPRSPLRQLVLDGQARTFPMLRGEDGWAVQVGGESWTVSVIDERTEQLQAMTGGRAQAQKGGVVKAPMPGLVLRLEVELGQRVEPGTGVVVLEAMKMENEIRSSVAGVVTAIQVSPGEAVEKGAPLVELSEQG